MRKAFTMLELVMVMVIMGIVASIGADIIASMYTNYLNARTVNTLEAKTEIVLEQIAKRLQYRVKESVIARISNINNNFTPLTSADDTYSVLEWIGYSNESLLGTPRPGWSGFIDLDSTENNKTNRFLKTPESNLSEAVNIISSLTDGNLTLSGASTAAGLIFKGRLSNSGDFGWNAVANTNGDHVILVTDRNETTFHIEETPPDEIYEQYYLAHSAYAIVPSDPNSTDFNLTLYYNYQPWLGQNYNSKTPSLLAEHVSLFRFKQDDTIIQLKLCLHDGNSDVAKRIVICKEKVVY